MEARITVLVTFYNQADYVDRAMNSVMEQKTDFPIRVVVGDDGSNDGTIEKVRKWIEKYPDQISLHVMPRDEGKIIPGFRASENRLNILQYVNTEYFIYLDGDDFFTSADKLQKQAAILDHPDNQDCIACGHNIEMLFPNGKKRPYGKSAIKEQKIDPRRYWKRYYVHTDTLLVRSSVIPKLPIEKLRNNFNDNLITCAVLQHGNLYYIPDLMAAYVQTGDGIWTTGKKSVNYIRNMFLYDLSIQINPKLKGATEFRCAQDFVHLYKMKDALNLDELKPYVEEAQKKQMKYTNLLIHYSGQKAGVKAYLWIHYVKEALLSFSRKVEYKLKISNY